MSDQNTIQTFKQLLGLSILDINYIETKFHYNLSGNWSAVDTDSFVLHSPEWEIKFSNGQKWFLTGLNNEASSEYQIDPIILVNTSSIAKSDDKINNVPRNFGWKNIFEKEITKIKFYKRVISTKSILGYEFSKVYQENILIIQLFCADSSFSLTTMDGDIGQSFFYPTGYLGNRIGFFFDKTIINKYSVYERTNTEILMRMEMIYQLTRE